MMKSILSLLLLAKQSLSSSSQSWDYDHMTEWSDEYSMCAAQDESPIDIDPITAVIDPTVCGAEFEWDIDFTKQTFKITNNGHSISLKPVQETDIDPDFDLSQSLVDDEGTEYISLALSDNTIAKFPNYFAEGSEHNTYCLDSLHFHWGTDDETGSEHLLDGYQYPLEVHFVHYSCDHSSLGSTLEQFPSKESVETASKNDVDIHQLGVVGIFFDVVENRVNPAFDVLFENDTLQHFIHPDGHDHAEIIYGFDISQVLPDHVNSEGYYAYQGSLTTPPCTNIVNWHMMNARGYIGKSQLEKFRQLMSTEDAIAPNYREVQDNANTVYSCVDVVVSEVFVDKQGKHALPVAIVISVFATAIIIGAISLMVYKKKMQKLIDQINDSDHEKRGQINEPKEPNQISEGKLTNV